jgi:glycosyltransferase involved in cell wall biosynthesis
MNVLVSTPAVVERVGNQYYNNTMSTLIPRYKQLGENLICLNTIVLRKKSTLKELDTNNVEFVSVDKVNSIRSLFITQKRNEEKVREAVRKADICVAHFPSFVAEQVARCAKKYNKPCLSVVAGCAWDAHWNYGIKGKLIAPFRFYTTKRAIYRASHVIYVTQEFLQKRYPTKGKSIGCSDVSIVSERESILLQRLKNIEQHKTILKIATIAAVDIPYKGQMYVIEALKLLKEKGILFEYHLVGGGDSSPLKSLVNKYLLQDSVFFHGLMAHEQIPAFLDDIDIYIQPSRTEGLPRALVEAMSRGCLSLGTDVGGIPELLDKKYLFPKGDVKEIVRMLKHITPEILEEQAAINLEKSELYDEIVLSEKRKKFFEEFLNDKL